MEISSGRLFSEFLFGFPREIRWLPTCDQRERVLRVTLQSSRSPVSHCARVRLLRTQHYWEHIKGREKSGGDKRWRLKCAWLWKAPGLFTSWPKKKTTLCLIVIAWKTVSIGNTDCPDRRGIIIAHRHCWADTTIRAIKGKKICAIVIMTQIYLLKLKMQREKLEEHCRISVPAGMLEEDGII